jgi:hypothetical protein
METSINNVDQAFDNATKNERGGISSMPRNFSVVFFQNFLYSCILEEICFQSRMKIKFIMVISTSEEKKI